MRNETAVMAVVMAVLGLVRVGQNCSSELLRRAQASGFDDGGDSVLLVGKEGHGGCHAVVCSRSRPRANLSLPKLLANDSGSGYGRGSIVGSLVVVRWCGLGAFDELGMGYLTAASRWSLGLCIMHGDVRGLVRPQIQAGG